VDFFPGETHAVEHARTEILHQHVAALDQRGQDFLALRILGVERDGALVVVEHREIQAVDIRNVLQLSARDIADAGALDLDHVSTEPGQQLRAGRSGLHVVKSRMRTPVSALVMIYFLLERFDGARSPRQARQTRLLGYACFFLLRMPAD